MKLSEEIRAQAAGLPPCRKHPIQNRCDKIQLITKKAFTKMYNVNETTTAVKDRTYIAKQAIKEALLAGRHLSQMGCREFQVEDMRTPRSHMRDEFPDTHELKSRWITTPVRRARIKEYWLERRVQS